MKHERISYTQVVWEITRLLQEAESLENALRTSLGEVVKAVGAEAGTIWFCNSIGDQRIYPSFTIGGADLTGMSLSMGEGIAGTVVQQGKTTVVKDCQSDDRWAGRFDEATGFVTRSMVCVPLINKYEVIGCIQIINKKDGSLYDDADVELCENLAMLTVIAVDEKGLNLGFDEERKAILSLRNVTKSFGSGETEIQILKGVNLDVREGEFLVILGESGCGKSTMLMVTHNEEIAKMANRVIRMKGGVVAEIIVNRYPAAVSIAIFHGFQSSANAILLKADQYFAENNLETLGISCANGLTQEELQLQDWIFSGRENVGDIRGITTITDTICGLSIVMALLFLLVAVVISFAAITRVIREQRMLIGDQKALGFTPAEIFRHYTLYNLICGILGTLLGWLLAILIVENMSLYIFVPKFCLGDVPLTFTWSTALLSGALCLVVFLVATLLTCTKLVREPAVDLLRGEVPAWGKRLFFEKWGFYQKLIRWLRHLAALCAVLALMLCLGLSSAFAADTVSGTDMRLTATEGTVTLQNADGKALSARESMRLYSGYTVTTGSRSYAYITIDSTKVVKLDANTTMRLSKDGGSLDLTVIDGKLFFNVKAPLSANESLNIRTSTMVTGIRGTPGVVEVQNSTTSSVSIYDGKVEVITNDGELLKNGTDALGLGGKLCDIAVLFVDIRGFTTMSEVLTPQQVVSILNRYLTLTTDCIMKNHGIPDKFVGETVPWPSGTLPSSRRIM